ncbi:hypothetical protein HOD20_03990 [archaeon]|jgi:hypothetical protein|nr:hypothetical protein [Candidatus Woesearchaeota archaeon]MBT3464712.1 hypothetical protein [archaeon]MBT4351664.1 hypothetical protein [archaeon]MBT4647559.1 hypothetical protein [archaeon]MBT6821945.1 hypothetical protein [archaeon]
MKESKIKVNRSKLLDRINLFKETIKEQDEYTNHLNIMLKEKEDELDELEHKMQFLIQEQEKEVAVILKSLIKTIEPRAIEDEISKKDRKIEELNREINYLEEASKKNRIIVGNFKSSIVFPLFKLSSRIGRTNIGKILQKLLK